ncbi:hypothetical protein [Deinococcus aquaticus]|uniref:Uncharacterized protein n=1 Tax=Deinococcus aquaticus TaxID=328692 RepID=A0ABY7UZ56_9DEIO|nr:hypothetical protein [Deinococcus aquaticus]WDA58170.1 hypothetical protein M8445_12545 [Deinococcus aquaticus]
MNFELFLINPVTYSKESNKAFSNAFGLTIEKSLNGIGSFSFAVALGQAKFKQAITHQAGMKHVMVYADGKPYMHGIITSYDSSDIGLTKIECREVLQLLQDSIIEGKYEITNIQSEYIPPSTGVDVADHYDLVQYPYWNKANGLGYWYARSILLSPATDKLPSISDYGLKEDSNGVSMGSGELAKNFVYNRYFAENPKDNYSYMVKSNGIGALSVLPICSDEPPYPQGILFDAVYSISETTGEPLDGYVFAAVIDYEGKISQMYQHSLPVFNFNNREVSGLYAAARGEVECYYDFKTLESEYIVDRTIVINFNGQRKITSFEGMSFPKSLFDVSKLNARGAICVSQGTTITSALIGKDSESSIVDFINESSDSIAFSMHEDSAPANAYVTKLSYSDSDRWSIISDLLNIEGGVSLRYKESKLGVISYEIVKYDQLQQVVKFTDGSDVFNVEYLKDFADVYNVLTARCNYSHSHNQYSYNNSIEIVLRPDAERPNYLGRLKEKVVSSNSIKDIYTLTLWASSIYDEHCYPASPIDFDTLLSADWLDMAFGQTVIMHGLEEGVGISEKLNKISIDTSTGIARISLAKRVSLASALLENRLNANI